MARELKKLFITKVTVVVLVTTLMIGAGYFLFSHALAEKHPRCPLPDYASYSGRTEDLLILEGNCVVPTAIHAVSDRALSKRPFVISFLGNGEFREALDPLKNIVEDATDPDRGPAIIAVFRIDNDAGRQLARTYIGEGGELGKICHDILVNKGYLQDRTTYWQALRNDVGIRHGL